jgi:nicotinate-nucleotide adenylyltransferase
LLAYCSLGVLRRAGDTVDLPALEARLPGVTAKVRFVEVAPLDVASHEIRRRVRAGESISDLVPQAVAEVIRSRRLYSDLRAEA